jgi:hypothetical protein
MNNYEDIAGDDGFLFDPDNWSLAGMRQPKKLWLDL